MTLRFEIFPPDLDATVDFYRRVLRFALVRDERAGPDPYVALRRGHVLVGAAARPQQEQEQERHRRPPTGVELVLEVDDVDAEHDAVLAAGWPLVEGLRERPWGLRDFRLLDAAGYYLRVTERVTGDGE